MRLKHRVGDFQVREILRPDYLREAGAVRVYRVTKRKLTSLQAAGEIAHQAGVPPSAVGMAGLKDRQGVTTQFMSVSGGKPVEIDSWELSVSLAGFAEEPLTPADSLGNRFRVVLRDVDPRQRERLDVALSLVRRHGLPNYFDDQRFGNLEHGQGWVTAMLMRGQVKMALKRMIASESHKLPQRERAFHAALRRDWGDWQACRDHAGRFGRHHSLFEHLRRSPNDFAGAFRHLSRRERVIHLYAFQSHLWNRALAATILELSRESRPVSAWGIEGPLVFHTGPLPIDVLGGGHGGEATAQIPGSGFEDVPAGPWRERLVEALRSHGIDPEGFRVEGIAGFAPKGETRAIVVRPREVELTSEAGGRREAGTVELAFRLPRGAYATLVIKRLFARRRPAQAGPEDGRRAGGGSGRGPKRRGGGGSPGSAGKRGTSGRAGAAGGERHPDERSNGRWSSPPDGDGARGAGRRGEDRRGSWGAKAARRREGKRPGTDGQQGRGRGGRGSRKSGWGPR